MKQYTPAAQRKKSALREAQSANEPDSDTEQARKTGERQLGVMLRDMRQRQQRIDAIEEAAQKLDVVRSLMGTKGAHAVPKMARDLKDAVSTDGAKVTASGLVVDRGTDDDVLAPSAGQKRYKWSNERRK